MLHYRSKQKLENFFPKNSENFRSDFKEKLFFTDPSMKMIADIVDAIEKCLNFIIFEKKMKKNMPPTSLRDQTTKKAEKCVFSPQG